MKDFKEKNDIPVSGRHLLVVAVLSLFLPFNALGRSADISKDSTITSTVTVSQEDTTVSRRKVFNGCGGGMMVSGCYLFGTIPEAGFDARGPAFGIGGQARVGLGKHFRIGGEGYVVTAGRMGNGSYLRYGWGGILGDFCWRLEKVVPYVGVTLGGGSRTSFLMFEGSSDDWEKEDDAMFNKQGFFAVSPFVGCEVVISKAFHLNLKLDCLNAVSSGRLLRPFGPTLYFGFSFCH